MMTRRIHLRIWHIHLRDSVFSQEYGKIIDWWNDILDQGMIQG